MPTTDGRDTEFDRVSYFFDTFGVLPSDINPNHLQELIDGSPAGSPLEAALFEAQIEAEKMALR